MRTLFCRGQCIIGSRVDNAYACLYTQPNNIGIMVLYPAVMTPVELRRSTIPRGSIILLHPIPVLPVNQLRNCESPCLLPLLQQEPLSITLYSLDYP